MVILNEKSILMKVMAAGKTRRIATIKAVQKFEKAKQSLLDEFNESPVTRELLAGPDQPFSEVLPMGYGNLFSFLGFDRGKENPIHPVKRLLEQIHLIKTPKFNKLSLTFTVKIPSSDELDKASPMEWETGRSWIDAVTYGIGTFSHYLFSLREGGLSVSSRSGTGIQTKNSLRSSSSYFSGIGYVIGMLGKFRKQIS